MLMHMRFLEFLLQL